MDSPWKRALIVGASSGIGEELARQLARQGCQVALVARREDELKRIAGEINAAGVTLARTYVHDVREVECVPALLQQIAHDLGGLDLVIYAAGVMPLFEPDEYSFAKDKLTIETNVTGAVAWLNEAAQRFERAQGGTILGISSVAGERGRRNHTVYGASKAFLTAYLESLRNRLAPAGVTVITVKPGPVATPMTADVDPKKLPMLISAEKAGTLILAAVRRGRTDVYVPGAWRWIFLILRNIPSFLFKKMKV